MISAKLMKGTPAALSQLILHYSSAQWSCQLVQLSLTGVLAGAVSRAPWIGRIECELPHCTEDALIKGEAEGEGMGGVDRSKQAP